MYAKKISIPATDHRSVIFLDDFDKADEEERRHSLLQYLNEITKTVERKQILAVSDNSQLWLHSPINGSVERKQITSFIFERLNHKNLSMNPAVIRSQEHVKQLSSVI